MKLTVRQAIAAEKLDVEFSPIGMVHECEFLGGYLLISPQDLDEYSRLEEKYLPLGESPYMEWAFYNGQLLDGHSLADYVGDKYL